MKVIKKIDDCYRILISKEIREKLNLKKYQEIEVELDEEDNKIILTPIEKPSKKVLSEQNNKNIPLEVVNDKLVYDNARLPLERINETTTVIENKEPDLISELPASKRKFKWNDEIEFITSDKDLKEDDEVNLIFCSTCDKVVEPDAYVKINGKRICKDCIKDLKNQLISDIS